MKWLILSGICLVFSFFVADYQILVMALIFGIKWATIGTNKIIIWERINSNGKIIKRVRAL